MNKTRITRSGDIRENVRQALRDDRQADKEGRSLECGISHRQDYTASIRL